MVFAKSEWARNYYFLGRRILLRIAVALLPRCFFGTRLLLAEQIFCTIASLGSFKRKNPRHSQIYERTSRYGLKREANTHSGYCVKRHIRGWLIQEDPYFCSRWLGYREVKFAETPPSTRISADKTSFISMKCASKSLSYKLRVFGLNSPEQGTRAHQPVFRQIGNNHFLLT